MEKLQPRKRPVGVWIITVYFAISIPFVIFSLYAVLSNQIPLDAAQAGYIASMAPLDFTATAIIAICNLLGAVSLFRLRKAALTFFTASLAINIALTIWHIIAKGFVAVVGGALPIVLGFALLLAIIAYTAHLARKRVLQ